jgi:hypothetical protein
MTVTSQSLADDFKRFNDDALIELVRSAELTQLALGVAKTEIRRRGLVVPAAEIEPQDVGPTAIRGDLVQLARTFTAIEAQMLRSRLEVEGIPAVVTDDNIVQASPLLSLAIGGARVLVPESYFELATEIAAAVARGEYALDDETDVG